MKACGVRASGVKSSGIKALWGEIKAGVECFW